MARNTIFIQIASYRDPELLNTLNNLIINAKKPENLRFGIAWQHDEKDTWDTFEKFNKDSRFKILDIKANETKGVCWARNKIQELYNGEKFTLQLDSHHRFIKNWDVELIKMYNKLVKAGHQKPLITSYLPSFFPETDPENRTQEVWKMDFNRFTPEGYIFTFPSVIENWKKLKEPIPARFYSAHFAFTTGKFCEEVKHDPNMYFHGEEPSIAARAYTWGYDLFHPHKIIGWHEYTREGKKKHWDDHRDWHKQDQESHHRYRMLHGMDGIECTPCVRKSLGEYYFGEERTLEDYERYIGVRFKDRKVQQYTLDRKDPPNPIYKTEEEFEKSLIARFKHCIDIPRSHFKEDDYTFWVVSFETKTGDVISRLDADSKEVKSFLKAADNGDGWVRIWRDFEGIKPDKWVVWPHSEKKGFIERLEHTI